MGGLCTYTESAGNSNDCDEELAAIIKDPMGSVGLYGMKPDALKLTMNAFYGKTIENVENRSNNEIVSDVKTLERLASSPLFINYKRVSENKDGGAYFAKRRKQIVCLDKPIYIGKTILDRSKLSLMKFVQEELLRVYGVDNVQIGGTDTNSIHVMITGYDRETCYSKFSEFNCVMDNLKMAKGLTIGTYKRDESRAGELLCGRTKVVD